MNNLKTVLQQLKSDKIKERQEGLFSIRTVFAQDKVVANFHIDHNGNGDPRAWLSVFQALFHAVLNEKLACTKKTTSKSAGSTATAQRRLAEAASAVRWLTERTAHLMNKRVAKALFEHLLQTMVHKGELLTPVALDYVKALRCLVSWTPHVEHMDEDSWVRMVEMAFNVVLGDPVRASFQDDRSDQGHGDAGSCSDADDSEYFVEDLDEDENDRDNLLSMSTHTQSRKRRRREQSATKRKSQMKPKHTHRQAQVSLEQIEFTSLLHILLRSSSAPILSPSYPHLASSILVRLQRFLDLYPADTSLHHDYLLAVSSTLSHLSLNRKNDVQNFARGTWDGLVGLWGTKNKRMKEGLVAVLRVLFPFVTADDDISLATTTAPAYSWADGIGRLWHLLDGEADSRWGVDGLSLDSLRLEVVASGEWEEDAELAGERAFVARTYRAGWNFEPGQALAWAILELQADCAEKLFLFSESVHGSTLGTARSEGKRPRLENPITALLHSIQTQIPSPVRAYHLQILLFFIDRHWSILHDTLQQDVISTLLQFVAFDDGAIQSWTFMCFAAIAYADINSTAPINTSLKPTSRSPSRSSFGDHPRDRDATTWDPIWTHAIRRANVPTVCRAACHTAHTLLMYSHSHLSAPPLLTSNRVLLEIETFTKDLDVQGPAYPYDSVCVFLAQCLRVASQDVRLYRMQLEEKVLSWLVDCWKVGDVGGVNGRATDGGRMPLYTVRDILLILESISGFSKRSDLVCRLLLPECRIVDTLVEEGRTKVIRDFLLNAKLPTFRKPGKGGKVKLVGSMAGTAAGAGTEEGMVTNMPIGANSVDLVQPRGRERKVSAFMLKFLETLVSEWEVIKEDNGHPTAEKARRSLDTAVIALCFESLLALNGTRSNRHVVQCACKLFALATARLTDARWTVAEKALVLLGLKPLTSTGEEERDDGRWEAMLPPGMGTGIKTQTLRTLISDRESSHAHMTALRRDFQRIIWQSTDVQDVFSTVMNTLKDVLRIVANETPNSLRSLHVMDIDDKDGFGPIRTTATQSPEVNQQNEGAASIRYIAEVCMTFLAVVPILQSSSGEPTRDRDLTELVLGCAKLRPEKFLLVCPIFLDKIRQRTLNLTVNNLDKFLDEFAKLLQLYTYARSEQLQLLATHFLDSTLHIWLIQPVVASEVGDKVRQLYEWLSGTLRKQKIRAWKIRDSLARFFDRYLSCDPSQVAWTILDDDEDEQQKLERLNGLPSALLPMMGSDEDIRVRFRVAVVNARLFAHARRAQHPALATYDTIKQWYTIDLDNYEHMLTRMLSLGNIMVVSSAVRRGPYWHLLETCLHSPLYSRHIEAILSGVSDRMGLTTFSVLFEAYASQLAYSIRQAGSDFLRFPPHLLGYGDRKECAEAAFRAFTPTNVLAGGPRPEAIIHGQKLFANHCGTIQKSAAEGIRECFGDIIGYQVLTWIDEVNDGQEEILEQLLRTKTMNGEDLGNFDETLEQNVDGIVASILRTLGDQDFTPEGAIIYSLQAVDDSGKAARAFRAMARHRRVDDFETHEPNLPTFSTKTVLQALTWFSTRVPDAQTKATSYHVLHELFADVQRSPLVNEQIRLINAISLWVAVHHRDFEDSTLLHTLMHGATSLLAESDLARAAQSMLEWAFSYYRKTKTKDPRFPDVLIRICCLAQDYALNTEDIAVANMGNDLIGWIDSQVWDLSKVSALRGQIVRALPAWPHQPSPELAQLYDTITSESLSAVLSDHRISSNKFRSVRRLRDHAVSKDYGEVQFATTDFWRLKECVPSADQLQDDDVDAFAVLLALNKGRINSFGSEQPNSMSVRDRHRRDVQKRTSTEDGTSPRNSIIHSLLAMLDGNTLSKVYIAYRTLRLLMSVLTPDISHPRPLAAEHRVELEYLQTYPRTPGTRPPRDMSELLTLETYIDSARDFPRWIAMITTLLSDILAVTDSFYAQLTSILQSDVAFAEDMLPVLVHTILQAEKSNGSKIKVSFRTLLSNYFTSILSSDGVSVSCLRSIVDIVLHLRHFRPRMNDALAYDKWLDIDFTLLASSAITCGAYTTALLFLELASEYQGVPAAENAAAEQILFDIYSHIDEPDGFYGIKTGDLHHFLIKRFHHEKQWEKAFRFHGAALEAGNTDSSEAEGLLQSFHSFGFDHLAIDTLQSSSTGTGNMFHSSGMSYRLGWRTDTWDLPDRSEEQSSGASLYLALRAIYRERDPRAVDTIVRRALFGEMGRLRALGSENLAEIRAVVQNLMCLSQVAQWRDNSIQKQLKSKHIDINEWMDFIQIDSDFDFLDLENIMATRISLIRSVRQKEERQQIGILLTPFAQSLIEVEKKCLVRLSEAARDAHQIQIALNSVVRAQRLESSPSFEVSQEFASVLWIQKEEKLAVQFLKELVARDEPKMPSQNPINATQKASLLARLGAWTSEACLEKPTDIWTTCFDPATSLVNDMKTKTPSDLDPAFAAVYHQCAMFAERQYHAIILKSPDAIRWKVYVERKTQEIQRREDQIKRTFVDSERNALKEDQKKAEKLLTEDRELFRKHNSARETFLEQAIEMYSRCLETSDSFDTDGAIRLCSLWFANFDEMGLQDKVRIALDRVPSRKLVLLAHQLSARLSKSPTTPAPMNQENLQRLVIRMCEEHPFHSLSQVYCLRPDRSMATPARRHSDRQSPSSTQTEREAAAGDIFDRLRGDATNGERVRAMEQLCDACLQWAKFAIKANPRFDNKQKTPFKVPDGLLIGKISNLRVPVLTSHTPLDPTLRYDDCAWLDRYETTFETAGGMNLPKISICYSTDGQKHKQLFKGEGNDDLRQDAVMEQVFDLVNNVLRRDRETRRRNLSVRDYKVIPLASQAGVMEFVGNTLPLQMWLAPAHVKYRPNDMKSNDALAQLTRMREECGGQAEPLLNLFLEIRKRFKPVMRHYFTERHKTPISWFAMRLNYTRSVATTSIVGHVLGLGDRHISNILLDNGSGEVVHIDLGIAFDQGKLLKVPETVPFRMTADMVDGMGTSGTQGVFQRCAEETLRVLREGSEVIMTVLEVFKYDPLHSWTASELKVQQMQGTSVETTANAARFGIGIGIDMASGTAEEAADRALTSVARKLDKSLSVEYTVNELIAEATDPVNLATIFRGWSPHC